MKKIRFAVLLVGSLIILSGCIGQLITPAPQDLPTQADQVRPGSVPADQVNKPGNQRNRFV